MKKSLILGLVFLAYVFPLCSQVKIGGSGAPDPNAVLELDGGADKGLLLPRLTDAQMNAMVTPPNGILIFNTTDGFIYYHHSGVWQKVSNSASSTGFELPYEDTLDLSGGYMFKLTNTGATGGALLGIGTDGASGAVGYSENGNGIVGNSNTGLGGYFSSISGTAIYAGGKIGINTITPTAELGFTGDTGNKIAMGDNATNHFGIGLRPGLLQLYADQASSDIAFGSGSSMNFNEVMRIKGSGNIGIGTTNPEAPLSFSNTNGNKLLLKGNASAQFGFGINNNLMQIYADGAGSDIAFGYGSSSTFSERLRIKGDGKVGIGTSTPAYAFTLQKEGIGYVQKGTTVEMGMETKTNAGMIKTITNHSLWFGTNNSASPQMAINLNGQVGIGTHLPGATLDVVDNDPNILRLTNSNSLADGQETRLLFKNSPLYTGMITTEGTSGTTADLKFYTGAGLIPGSLVQRMVITNDGKIGIGVDAPASKLDVNGKGKFKREASDKYAIDLTGSIAFRGNSDDLPIFTVSGSGNPGQESIYLEHPLLNNDQSFVYVQLIEGYKGTYGVRYNTDVNKWEIYVINPIYFDNQIHNFFQMCNGECESFPIPEWKIDDLADASFSVLILKKINN